MNGDKHWREESCNNSLVCSASTNQFHLVTATNYAVHCTALLSCQRNQANLATWRGKAVVFSNYLLLQMLDILAKVVSSFSYWRAVANVYSIWERLMHLSCT